MGARLAVPGPGDPLPLSKFAEYVPGRAGGLPPLSDAEGLVIRAAIEPDLLPLAAIAAEREGGPVEEWEKRFERLYAEVASGAAALLVAALEGEPIGYGKVASSHRLRDRRPMSRRRAGT